MENKLFRIVTICLLVVILCCNIFGVNGHASSSNDLETILVKMEEMDSCIDCVNNQNIIVGYEEEIAKLNEKIEELSVKDAEKDIVFVGNSLSEGLRLNAGSEAIFLSKGGINVEGLKSGIYDALTHYECKKVIIQLGTNEIEVLNREEFIKSYQDLIAHIRSINPNSEIIVLSIPPVTKSRSESDVRYNNENIKIYNEYVIELCEMDKTLKYLDNEPFFTDVLNTEWSGDGVHLYNRIYKLWYEYIMENI